MADANNVELEIKASVDGVAAAPEGTALASTGASSDDGKSANADPAPGDVDASSSAKPSAPPVQPTSDPAVLLEESRKKWESERRMMQKRIDKITAQKKELEGKTTTSGSGDTLPLDAQVEALAEQKAQLKFQQQQFANRIGAIQTEGEQTFGKEKFLASTQSLASIRDTSSDAGQKQYLDFLAAIAEVPEASKVVMVLGEDLEEATRIMELSPVQQGIALARVAGREIAQVSKAPKPITPIGARGASHVAIAASDKERGDSIPIDVWMERRKVEAEDFNKRAGRRVI